MSAGNLRNELCGCGSGKKFKKCCFNKKPRSTTLDFDFGREVETVGAGITHDNRVEFLGKDREVIAPEVTWISSSYGREKGPKIVNFGPSRKAYIDPNLALMQYDRIFAIDTNTKEFNFARVSLACVVLCQDVRRNADTVVARFAPVHCFEFWNCKKNPEKIAWRYLINRIMTTLNTTESQIGIVVDSDLGNLSKYNSRIIPIVDDFCLPSNFTLIYASADVGKENLSNQFISVCDKEAAKMLTWINDERSFVDLVRQPDSSDYQYFRGWSLNWPELGQ